MRRAWSIVFGCGIVCAAALWCSRSGLYALAQSPPPSPTQEQSGQPEVQPAQVEDRGVALIDQARRKLADAKTVSVAIEQVISMTGIPSDMISTYQLSIQRPDKLALELKDGMMGHTIINDGENVYTYLPAMQRYFKRPAPEDVQTLLSGASDDDETFMGDPLLTLVGPLLFVRDSTVMAVSDVQYLGAEKMDDETPVHRIKLTIKPKLGIGEEDADDPFEDDLNTGEEDEEAPDGTDNQPGDPGGAEEAADDDGASIPPPLTQDQIDAMNLTEARSALMRIARARQEAPAAEQDRLRNETKLLLEHIRDLRSAEVDDTLVADDEALEAEEFDAELEFEDGEEVAIAFDLWLEDGGQGLPLRLELDTASMIEAMGDNEEAAETFKEMNYRYQIRFKDWHLNPEIPAERFAFTPPPEAKEVESPMDIMAEFAGEEDEDSSVLVGEPAPDFELENLEGKTITLAQHKDRDIVILDFWATWCAPCIRALPEVNKAVGEFADRNVVLYAVNQDEEKDDVQSFLEKKKWTLQVLLDPGGKIGDSFMVSGIPQTVIVDKSGIVQAVHVGYSSDIGERLKREIETLLAGGSLIPDDDEEDERVDDEESPDGAED